MALSRDPVLSPVPRVTATRGANYAGSCGLGQGLPLASVGVRDPGIATATAAVSMADEATARVALVPGTSAASMRLGVRTWSGCRHCSGDDAREICDRIGDLDDVFGLQNVAELALGAAPLAADRGPSLAVSANARGLISWQRVGEAPVPGASLKSAQTPDIDGRLRLAARCRSEAT